MKVDVDCRVESVDTAAAQGGKMAAAGQRLPPGTTPRPQGTKMAMAAAAAAAQTPGDQDGDGGRGHSCPKNQDGVRLVPCTPSPGPGALI